MKNKSKLPKAVLEFFQEQGRIGAKKRAANLTPEERSAQARKAVQARWAKEKTKNSKKSATKKS
jgi:uncharacterized protein YdaU (DUF1376 family)